MVRLKSDKVEDSKLVCSRKKSPKDSTREATVGKKDAVRGASDTGGKRSLRALAAKPNFSGNSVDFRKYPLMGKKIIVRGRKFAKGRTKKPVETSDGTSDQKSGCVENCGAKSLPNLLISTNGFQESSPSEANSSSNHQNNSLNDASSISPKWRIPACILEIVPEQPPRLRKIRKEKWKIRPSPSSTSGKQNTTTTSTSQLRVDTTSSKVTPPSSSSSLVLSSLQVQSDSSSSPSSISSYRSSDAETSRSQDLSKGQQHVSAIVHRQKQNTVPHHQPRKVFETVRGPRDLPMLPDAAAVVNGGLKKEVKTEEEEVDVEDKPYNNMMVSSPQFEASTLLALMKDRMLDGTDTVSDVKPGDNIGLVANGTSRSPKGLICEAAMNGGHGRLWHGLEVDLGGDGGRGVAQKTETENLTHSPVKTCNSGPRGCTIIQASPVLRGCVLDEVNAAGQRGLIHKNLRVSLSQPSDLNLTEDNNGISDHHIQQIDLYSTWAVGKRRPMGRRIVNKSKEVDNADCFEDEDVATWNRRPGFRTPQKRIKNGMMQKVRRKSGDKSMAAYSPLLTPTPPSEDTALRKLRSGNKRPSKRRRAATINIGLEDDYSGLEAVAEADRRLLRTRSGSLPRRDGNSGRELRDRDEDPGRRLRQRNSVSRLRQARRAITFEEEGESSSSPAFLSGDENSFSPRLPGIQEISGQFSQTGLKWNATHTINKQGVYCYCGEPGDWFRSMVRCVRCQQWFHERCLQPRPRSMPIVQGDTFYLFVCSVCNYGVECLKRLPLSWQQFVHIAVLDLSLKYQRRHLHLMRDIYPALINNCALYQVPKMIHSHPDKQEEILHVLKFSGKFVSKGDHEWGLKELLPPPIPNFSLRYNGVVSERNVLDDAIRCSDITYKQQVQINKYPFRKLDGSSSVPGDRRCRESSGLLMSCGKVTTRTVSSSSSSSPTRAHHPEISSPSSPRAAFHPSSSSPARNRPSHRRAGSSPATARASHRGPSCRTRVSRHRAHRGVSPRSPTRAAHHNGSPSPKRTALHPEDADDVGGGATAKDSSLKRRKVPRTRAPHNKLSSRVISRRPSAKREYKEGRRGKLGGAPQRLPLPGSPPPPPAEVPLEVVRPLPLDLSHQLILKGFPRVCVKFASIVPSRKADVETILEVAATHKKKQNKGKKRFSTSQGSEAPAAKKQKVDGGGSGQPPSSRSSSGHTTPAGQPASRSSSGQTTPRHQGGGGGPLKFSGGGSCSQLLAGLKNGQAVSRTGPEAASKMSGGHQQQQRLLDDLIPVRSSYSGDNNPFQLGCTETLRRARSMLCNRKLDWSDLTKTRSRLRKRKNPLSIEAARRIWRQGGEASSLGEVKGEEKEDVAPSSLLKGMGTRNQGAPPSRLGRKTRLTGSVVEGEHCVRTLNNNNYKSKTNTVIKLTGSQKRKSCGLSFKIDLAAATVPPQAAKQNGPADSLSDVKPPVHGGHQDLAPPLSEGQVPDRRVTRAQLAVKVEAGDKNKAEDNKKEGLGGVEGKRPPRSLQRGHVTRGSGSSVKDEAEKGEEEGAASAPTKADTRTRTRRGRSEADAKGHVANGHVNGDHVITGRFKGEDGEVRVFVQKTVT